MFWMETGVVQIFTLHAQGSQGPCADTVYSSNTAGMWSGVGSVLELALSQRSLNNITWQPSPFKTPHPDHRLVSGKRLPFFFLGNITVLMYGMYTPKVRTCSMIIYTAACCTVVYVVLTFLSELVLQRVCETCKADHCESTRWRVTAGIVRWSLCR